MPRQRIQVGPPDWWSPDLYSFVRDMPLEGWVWEFMRRHRLWLVLDTGPVDAMNPHPTHLSLLPRPYRNYYRSWAWFASAEGLQQGPSTRPRRNRPIYLPPAVFPPSGRPSRFKEQQYRINPDDLAVHGIEGDPVRIRVDLNRRDTVIKAHFEEVLADLRAERPEPKRSNPRLWAWRDQHLLEVWDLRQFHVSLSNIVSLFPDLESVDSAVTTLRIQPVRNALRTASEYINGGKWLQLAYYADVEQLAEE